MKTNLLYLLLSLLIFTISCDTSNDNSGTQDLSNSVSLLNADSIANQIVEDEIVFEFAFVSSNKYIVLEADADETLATGNAYSPIGYADARFSAIKDISENNILEKYKDLVGQSVLVGTKEGELLEFEILSIKIMAECIPHFGSVKAWNG